MIQINLVNQQQNHNSVFVGSNESSVMMPPNKLTSNIGSSMGSATTYGQFNTNLSGP